MEEAHLFCACLFRKRKLTDTTTSTEHDVKGKLQENRTLGLLLNMRHLPGLCSYVPVFLSACTFDTYVLTIVRRAGTPIPFYTSPHASLHQFRLVGHHRMIS